MSFFQSASTSSAPTIRPYRPGDAIRIITVAEDASIIDKLSGNGSALRVLQAGDPVSVRGFIAYREIADNVGSYVSIDWVAVDSAWRRRGLARAMLTNMILAHSHLWRGITAEICETNLPAANLLKACGFRCRHIVSGLDGQPDSWRFWRQPEE